MSEEKLLTPRELDPELMNPKRFSIVTYLYVFGPKTMAELVRALGLTWGDLDSNIRRLKEKGYVLTRRQLTLRGPRVFVELTEKGRRAYEDLAYKLNKITRKYIARETGVSET